MSIKTSDVYDITVPSIRNFYFTFDIENFVN